MDPYERSKLGDAVQEHTFKKDELIIKEGDDGDNFYLIQEGTAIANKNQGGQQVKVKDYSKGDYFGERALITKEMRAASIVVTSDECSVLSLNRDTFNRLLGSLEDILRRNMEQYHQILE